MLAVGEVLLVGLPDLVDELQGLADLGLELLLGDLLLVEDHDVAEVDLAGGQPLAQAR